MAYAYVSERFGSIALEIGASRRCLSSGLFTARGCYRATYGPARPRSSLEAKGYQARLFDGSLTFLITFYKLMAERHTARSHAKDHEATIRVMGKDIHHNNTHFLGEKVSNKADRPEGLSFAGFRASHSTRQCRIFLIN